MTAHFIWHANGGGFCHCLMLEHGVFHIRRPYAVTCRYNNVIITPREPIAAVTMALDYIASQIVIIHKGVFFIPAITAEIKRRRLANHYGKLSLFTIRQYLHVIT